MAEKLFGNVFAHLDEITPYFRIQGRRERILPRHFIFIERKVRKWVVVENNQRNYKWGQKWQIERIMRLCGKSRDSRFWDVRFSPSVHPRYTNTFPFSPPCTEKSQERLSWPEKSTLLFLALVRFRNCWLDRRKNHCDGIPVWRAVSDSQISNGKWRNMPD